MLRFFIFLTLLFSGAASAQFPLDQNDNVTVIAVDIMEPAPLVQGWAAALGVPYPIWMAPDWTLFELFPGAGALP